MPIVGNHAGSYFTLSSKNGIYFGIIHSLGNFGLVIVRASPAALSPHATLANLLLCRPIQASGKKLSLQTSTQLFLASLHISKEAWKA